MTVEKDTVYRGLLRPAKLFGLPLTSAVILLVTMLLGFMWAESFWALASIIVFYPALYGLAKWDPNFFDVITRTLRNFGPSKNRKVWGGDSYEP